MLSSLPTSTRTLALLGAASAVFCVAMALRPATAPASKMATAAVSTQAPVTVTTMKVDANGMPNAADPAWSRPLFFGNRRPQAARLDNGSTVPAPAPPTALNASLTGVVRSPTVNLASLRMMSGEIVRVPLGSNVPNAEGWRLVSLNSRTAVFRNQDSEVVLKLDPRQATGDTIPNVSMSPYAAPSQGGSNDAMRAAAAAMAAAGPDQSQPAPITVPPAPPATPTMTQQQQVEALQRRIEQARTQMRQHTTPPNSD